MTPLELGQPAEDVCQIPGCTKRRKARGLCDMHVTRLYRHGDPQHGASRKGKGYIHENGYIQVGRKGHPLAIGDRQNVPLHRAILYDAIGPGPHGCHWCGVLIAWTPTAEMSRLVVDHLDENKLNNARSNLVQSCQPCNVSRRAGSIRAAGVLS
jgi:HNH endonuclease